MAILTKLFATSMVAKSFLGRSKSLEIIWKAVDLSSNPLSRSDRVKEKRATSAPEMSAEQMSRAIIKMMPTMSSRLPED